MRQLDIGAVLNTSLDYLNSIPSRIQSAYQLKDFVIGFMRTTPIDGFEYEVYFKNSESCCVSIKLTRGLQALRIYDSNVSEQSDLKVKKVVNFILPLSVDSKNLNLLKQFLSIFEQIAVKQDNGFSSLTIVLGRLNKTQSFIIFEHTVNKFVQRTNFKNVNILRTDMNAFSRAKLLSIGIDSCCSNDVQDLIFLCDVDIMYNQNFLDLCRNNAVKNKRVFFPILFSFYNPLIANNHTENKEETKHNFIISKESGYFRDSGFGMACMHKTDFNKIGGFNDWNSNEWGGEDLFLYRKFLKSNTEIFRSITPGLFHMYHPKECDKMLLNKIQYKDCLSVKVANEASQKTLGFLYFNITNFS